ncbi:glutamate--tRNA ligase family protein [Algoriphagus limi]|uniref:Glutamate--tRNA ligase family protein n=1 Tax=Algoriphagus limi TaxID=2975273 RepID=A0ABT2G2A6_9BACT|nr:glutamate--tRNA ligase family protein [Algoriphagus limi]MCS5489392.1 glutamate--tRNA ligase family protein [Algoriphagus limi]
MNFKLTRIAPTPSGFLHLGNAYSFLLTKTLAEKSGAKILLRIDDLDRERFRMEYLIDIFETLEFLEIPYDIGPKSPEDFLVNWTQLNRLDLYREVLDKLWEKRMLFACTCSRKKITQMDSSGYYLGHCLDRNIPKTRKETAWRINTLQEDLVSILDIAGKKTEEVIPQDVAFFVVRKKDEMPAYQLTSLVDDMYFGVDLIVRGKDLYSSSIAQDFLSNSLDYQTFKNTSFLHHPLLKGPKGKKLSKSEGASSIQYLRQSGKNLSDIFRLIGESLGSREPIENFEDFKKMTQL